MASDKQIFAAVEAADHEIRLIVGEFFNTRFNIIKVERVPVGFSTVGKSKIFKCAHKQRFFYVK